MSSGPRDRSARCLTSVIQVYFNGAMPRTPSPEDRSPSQYFEVTSTNRRSSSSRVISVRLPVELLERLATVGNDQGLAMSDTIRLVLERGLSEKKKGKQF